MMFTDKSPTTLNIKGPVMIQSFNTPQLSSAKPRAGLSSITELMPRLIRQYELQTKLAQQPTNSAKRKLNPAAATITITTSPAQQTTFGWD